MTNRELYEIAVSMLPRAYAPFSKYQVGAALLTKDGKLYTGVNVENSSFGGTICAERTAFFKAISEGERDFSMIAVVGGKSLDFKDYFTPCGVCRQVMREFCDESFRVIIGKNGDEYLDLTLGELLPHGFSPNDIER